MEYQSICYFLEIFALSAVVVIRQMKSSKLSQILFFSLWTAGAETVGAAFFSSCCRLDGSREVLVKATAGLQQRGGGSVVERCKGFL